MIKDVEFAFFAQLAYLNWNNLEDTLKKEFNQNNKENNINYCNRNTSK